MTGFEELFEPFKFESGCWSRCDFGKNAKILCFTVFYVPEEAGNKVKALFFNIVVP